MRKNRIVSLIAVLVLAVLGFMSVAGVFVSDAKTAIARTKILAGKKTVGIISIGALSAIPGGRGCDTIVGYFYADSLPGKTPGHNKLIIRYFACSVAGDTAWGAAAVTAGDNTGCGAVLVGFPTIDYGATHIKIIDSLGTGGDSINTGVILRGYSREIAR